MIYDCFTFFNELDLLEIRLNEMAPVVDRFVVVEATKTFQGKPKPLCFEENNARFAAFASKIIHVVVEFPDAIRSRYTGDATWQREFYQRDGIARGLIDAKPDDLVIVSDVDEIISADAMRRALQARRHGDLTVFVMQQFETFLNRRSVSIPVWYGPKMTERRGFGTPEELRQARPKCRAPNTRDTLYWRTKARVWNTVRRGVRGRIVFVHNAGWHFTSIGTFEAVGEKYAAFSHATRQGDHQALGADGFMERTMNRTVDVPMSEMPVFVQQNAHRLHVLVPGDAAKTVRPEFVR